MNRKEPIHIRRNIENFDDPYIADQHLEDNTVCKRCGDIYMSGRWYSKDLLPHKKPLSAPAAVAMCPACRKQQDRVPGGVLRISGNFFSSHEDEVMNLIRNETNKAQGTNPLERVMSMETREDAVEITTTNEKLAQRIGKALHKAYDGDIEYKWSHDTKIARVNWHRDM